MAGSRGNSPVMIGLSARPVTKTIASSPCMEQPSPGTLLSSQVEDKGHMKQFQEYSLFIDFSSGPEEGRVYHSLTLIRATAVGKLILDSLERQVWIVAGDKQLAKCHCAGLTVPTYPEKGKGYDKNSTIYFEVTNQALFKTPDSVPYQYYSDDDRLCHELVHASRMGRLGFYGMDYSQMTNYLNPEEFLAVHIQNVYLSNRGNPRYYLDTNTMKSVSKGDAYASFTRDKEALRAFKDFVTNDPLAAKVAGLRDPITSFNPFRDYSVLARI